MRRGEPEMMAAKSKLLIVFPHENLDYSPTTLNLYDALREYFEVEIVAIEQFGCLPHRESRNVTYVGVPALLRRPVLLVDKVLRRLGWKISLDPWLLALTLLCAIRKKPCAVAIGIDPIGLFVVQRTYGRAHMLSLELRDRDPFLPRLAMDQIASVIVQTESRYRHQFGDINLTRFYVQNAPIFRSPPSSLPQERQLVFCGTALPQFGLFHTLDFIERYPEFSLTIQGAVWPDIHKRILSRYGDLLQSGRLVVHKEYIATRELSNYLSHFYLGFCLYDLSIPTMNCFNYISAPSGKLFSYYAAGVPVIAVDIPGLQSVKEFGTGVLIQSFNPVAIHQAVEQVIASHAEMRDSCFKAARHFSFDSAIAPFCDFLTQSNSRRPGEHGGN